MLHLFRVVLRGLISAPMHTPSAPPLPLLSPNGAQQTRAPLWVAGCPLGEGTVVAELGVGMAFDGVGSVVGSGAGGDAGSGFEVVSLGALEGVKF